MEIYCFSISENNEHKFEFLFSINKFHHCISGGLDVYNKNMRQINMHKRKIINSHTFRLQQFFCSTKDEINIQRFIVVNHL